MKKIKNFKINIRPREISRILKKFLDVKELDIEAEEAVQRACYFYGHTIKPAVVYDTFSKESSDFNFDFSDFKEKWIAVSPFVLTIGSGLKDEFEKQIDIFGHLTTKIVSAISADTLEQSKNFVQRLIAEEAKQEQCELSRAVELSEDNSAKIASLLPLEKINVSIDEQNKFSPSYTVAGFYYWLPVKKRRK